MKCWTCGSHLNKFGYKCPDCKNLKATRKGNELLTELVSRHSLQDNRQLQIDRENQRHFTELSETLTSGLSQIASSIAWGQRSLLWQLEQQTDTLRSIDNTLKSPLQTKANELRQQADAAAGLGAFDDAIDLYEGALKDNRLDYRIYIGLAESYLQMEKPEEAAVILRKSLPYAPKGDFDYKSYSLRLVGHIYACTEDFHQATELLREAIELSPTYADAYYDHSQYCAQIGDIESCLVSLERAIVLRPLYWSLAQREANFYSVRSHVHSLLVKYIQTLSVELQERIKLLTDVIRRLRNINFATLSELGTTWRLDSSTFEARLFELQSQSKPDDLLNRKEALQTANQLILELKAKLDSELQFWVHKNNVLSQKVEAMSIVSDRNGWAIGCLPIVIGLIALYLFEWKIGLAVATLTIIASLIEGIVSSRRQFEKMEKKRSADLTKAGSQVEFYRTQTARLEPFI